MPIIASKVYWKTFTRSGRNYQETLSKAIFSLFI